MKKNNYIKNISCILVVLFACIQGINAQDGIHIPDQITVKSGILAERLIDGDFTTGWNSSRTETPSVANPEWIQFTYNQAKAVRTVKIARTTLAANNIGDIRDFSVVASNDGITWEVLFTYNDNYFNDPAMPSKDFIINDSENDLDIPTYLNYRILITKNRSGVAYARNTSSSEISLEGPIPDITPRNPTDLNLEIYQIKVSEGHATLVVVKNIDTDEVISSTLIDAGQTIADGQLIAKTIIDNAGSKLDNVFITHYDRDHYGGLSPNKGLLDQRCKVSNSGEFNIVPANPTVNKLEVYGVKDDTQNKAPTPLKNRMATYITSNTLTFNSWEVDTELSLSGSGNEIKLITLAVNGTLRNGLQRTKLSKNNRSGVALIVWGDFTFLIQGDIQGAGKDDQIGRTNVFYRPTLQAPTKRIPENWNSGVATVQQAKDLIIDPIDPDTPSGSNSGILRLNVNEMDKAGLPAQNPIALVDIENETDAEEALNGLSMFYHKYYIAYPNKWLHQLGGLINDYNDAGNYAHACVALIPHHGAMSSNAWFDTKYGIISNNARGNHGHPLPQAVEATYHTAGISDFYFTYLEDGKTYHGKVLDRLTEITNWKNNYVSTTVPSVQDVNFHVLDATQKYFKINVIQDEDGEKNFQINNGDAVTQSLIQCPNH